MPLSPVHRVARLVAAFAIGLSLALVAYRVATDPEPREQRRLEEGVVSDARAIVRRYVRPGGGDLELVDPLAPDRKVGKVYIYPTSDGWQVSGHYRRPGEETWHPWLMSLDGDRKLLSLSVRDDDAALARRATADPAFSVTR